MQMPLSLGKFIAFALFVSSGLFGQTTVPHSIDERKVESEEEKVVNLSPFVVTEQEDDGYRATSTLAGTRIRTDLRDVASSISVVTKEFMNDTAAVNAEDILVYTLGTEIGGLNGNYGGFGTDQAQGPSEYNSLLRPDANNRVRGLSVADRSRDFFLTVIPWDAYNVERMDIQRGPNSILFGLGAPGGILNASTKQALLNRNIHTIQTRVDNFGSYRGSYDYNQVLLPGELSVRLNGLYDMKKFRQDPAYARDGRTFVALKFDPKGLRRNGHRTSLRVNYEKGDIDANRPRVAPPGDGLTPWFQTGTTTTPDGRVYNNLNQQTFDWRYYTSYQAAVPNSGAQVVNGPNYQPSLGNVLLYGGNYAFFPDPATGVQYGDLYIPTTTFSHHNGLGPNGSRDGNVRGLNGLRWANIANTQQIAQNLGLPFASAYKNKAITDTSIFDYFNRLIDGPNKNEARKFEIYNVTLSQTFFNDRFGIEGSLDKQRYDDSSWALQFPGTGLTGGIIYVNVDEYLPDGSPNPNVGRPYIVTRTEFGAHGSDQVTEGRRVTAFADIRASDFMQRSWLTRLLGRHVFTGVYADHLDEGESRQWSTFGLADNAGGLLNSNSLLPQRGLQIVSYIGPDMRGRTSPAGLNLTGLTAPQVPTATSIIGFDSTWNRPTNPSAPGYVRPGAPWPNGGPFNNQTLTQSENPANYVGWVNRPVQILDSRQGNNKDLLTRVAQKTLDRVISRIFVWQGFLLDGSVVPTFGYRVDTAESSSLTAPLDPVNQYRDRNSPSYRFGGEADNKVRGISRSYGVVVHSPKWLRRNLPLGTSIDLFYNKSSNFQPAAGRVDALGNPVPPPQGDTKDYGILISTLDDKLVIRLNKYKSTASNAAAGLANAYMIGAVETRAWVAAKRLQAGLTGDSAYEGSLYNYGSMVNGIFVQTAEDRLLQQQHVDYVLQNVNPQLMQAWNFNINDDSLWQLRQPEAYVGPTGMTATTDTLSEGYEVEVNYRPIPNWDIAANVAKAVAQRSNIAGNMRQLIDERAKVWTGPGGDIRQNPISATTDVGTSWENLFYRPYLLQTLLEGSNVDEIRPWRVNVVTRYRFNRGALKGLMVGGAYRWQDRVVIGYKSIMKTVQGVDSETYDINSPYYGPTDDSIDLWVGYRRKLGKKIDWNVQLNLRNAFTKPYLIPVNAQPDGSGAAYRIHEGATWMLTNTFSF